MMVCHEGIRFIQQSNIVWCAMCASLYLAGLCEIVAHRTNSTIEKCSLHMQYAYVYIGDVDRYISVER